MTQSAVSSGHSAPLRTILSNFVKWSGTIMNHPTDRILAGFHDHCATVMQHSGNKLFALIHMEKTSST